MRTARQLRSNRGSILLEVVLALALFVGAATIISSGLNASIQSTDRIRLQNHAVNLAITVLSEMQMHARPIAAGGPEQFPPPFEKWSCKVEIAQNEAVTEALESLRPVEIVIRHSEENIVHRLSALFPASEIADSASSESVGVPETLL